ncbi:taste receptor type 2 member 40-like [Anomaloglossus baeobatrachus]|uniref:taste receptor type 2 member 40-like n=1 Tax=Anomaloglossus baeobatrachus TaxID=238106 RepID=UPI003F5026A9
MDSMYQLVLAVISWLSGVFLNSSVVTMYFRDWRMKERFSVCDRMFLFMALNNITLQCYLCYDTALFLFLRCNQVNNYIYQLIFGYVFIYGNFWHTAWLSLYYCLKVVNPTHDLISQFRKKLSSAVIHVLVATLVGLVFINLPFIWTMSFRKPQNGTSAKTCFFLMNFQYIYFNVGLGCYLPFIMNVICIQITVGSLLRHMWRMRRNASHSITSPHLQGYVRASRTMILQLLLNSFIFPSVAGMFLSSFDFSYVSNIIFWIALLLYPTAQAFTLILGNSKLHRRFFRQCTSSKE